MILDGLRHIHETGKLPKNRSEVDHACREVLKISPLNSVAREWLDTCKERRQARKMSKSMRG